ncbi:hypothetical protein [Streptomyces sp. NPDC086777]
MAEWIKRIPENQQASGLVASGAALSVKYKETAQGGLAVNIIEC